MITTGTAKVNYCGTEIFYRSKWVKTGDQDRELRSAEAVRLCWLNVIGLAKWRQPYNIIFIYHKELGGKGIKSNDQMV
jgi:hypothetical protein